MIEGLSNGNEPLTEGSEDGQMYFKAIEYFEVVCPRKRILLGQLIAFGFDLAMKLLLQPVVNSVISCSFSGLRYLKRQKMLNREKVTQFWTSKVKKSIKSNRTNQE